MWRESGQNELARASQLWLVSDEISYLGLDTDFWIDAFWENDEGVSPIKSEAIRSLRSTKLLEVLSKNLIATYVTLVPNEFPETGKAALITFE